MKTFWAIAPSLVLLAHKIEDMFAQEIINMLDAKQVFLTKNSPKQTS